jgi:hypothetical protein
MGKVYNALLTQHCVVGVDFGKTEMSMVFCERQLDGSIKIVHECTHTYNEADHQSDPGTSLTHQNDMSRMSIRERISNVLRTLTTTRKENQ